MRAPDNDVFAYSHLVALGACRPRSYACVGWKGSFIVSGDSSGSLHVLDIPAKKFRSFGTPFSNCLGIYFSPSKHSTRFLARFENGCGTWDARTLESLAPRKSLKNGEVSHAGWLSDTRPIMCMADGALRVFDATLGAHTSSVSAYPRATDLQIPTCGSPLVVMQAKTIM